MISQQEEHRAISAGSILVEKNTLLPGSLALEKGATESGWVQFMNNPDRHQVEDKLATAGWAFFLMAGTIRTTAFGFGKLKMIEAALKRLIVSAKRENCNCLEIDAVTTHSFLGMPFVRLSAHSRHIQSGMFFGNRAGTT